MRCFTQNLRCQPHGGALGEKSEVTRVHLLGTRNIKISIEQLMWHSSLDRSRGTTDRQTALPSLTGTAGTGLTCSVPQSSSTIKASLHVWSFDRPHSAFTQAEISVHLYTCTPGSIQRRAERAQLMLVHIHSPCISVAAESWKIY